MILRTESVYICGTSLYLLNFKNVQFKLETLKG